MIPALTSWRCRLHAVPVIALAGVLAGCVAGPDFKPPAPPSVSGYTTQPLTATTATQGVAAGSAQNFELDADIPGDWWALFHSQALDALIARALRNNHDLKAAQAALRVAHEDVLAQRGSFFPALSTGFNASRQKDPSAALAPVPSNNAYLYSLFTPQLSISYSPDLFGLNRRTRESLQAQEQAARFQMVAAWTTLTSNVVVAAVQEASLREQVRVTHELIDLEKHSLAILQLRFEKGDASKLDVAAQQSQLAQTESGLPALVKQQAATQHALAVLVGAFPGQAPTESFTLADLQLPQNLPVSLPSKLIAQRPDVRQTRANLHAASAAVGIAAAERLPNIELTANAGSTALAISKVFTSGTGFWARNRRTSRRGSRWSRPRTIVSPTPPRCTRRWAAAGGITRNWAHDNAGTAWTFRITFALSVAPKGRSRRVAALRLRSLRSLRSARTGGLLPSRSLLRR